MRIPASAQQGRTHRQRHLAVAVVVLAIVAAACGGTRVPDPVPVSGRVVAPATTTTAPATTSTTSAGSTGTRSTGGVVEPQIVCVAGDLAYLGYSSTHDEVVAIPEGPDNQIVDQDGEPVVDRLATVFAPGTTEEVVAWASPFEGLTWVLRDGSTTTRLVIEEDAAPACPSGNGGGSIPELVVEPGEASYAVTSEVTRDADGRVVDAEIEVRLDGYRTTSRCPGGPVDWNPRPREVRITDVFEPDPEAPTGAPEGAEVFRFTVEDPQLEETFFDGSTGKGATKQPVYADVDEVCVDDDGNVHRAWSASTSLLFASFFETEICVETVLADDVEDVVEGPCRNQLPKTGGIRIRS